MATQKICDRCGKPVVADKLPWLIMSYKPGDDSRYPFEDMAWDLCQGCENELIQWQSYAYTAPLENKLTEDDKRKLEKLVDQGAFDRVTIITAKELKEMLERNKSGSGTDA